METLYDKELLNRTLFIRNNDIYIYCSVNGEKVKIVLTVDEINTAIRLASESEEELYRRINGL